MLFSSVPSLLFRSLVPHWVVMSENDSDTDDSFKATLDPPFSSLRMSGSKQCKSLHLLGMEEAGGERLLHDPSPVPGAALGLDQVEALRGAEKGRWDSWENAVQLVAVAVAVSEDAPPSGN